MGLKKIILKRGSERFQIFVKECNFLERYLGLMVFKKKALLLLASKKPKRYKIHSFFCNPFIAVYTDDNFEIGEIIKVTKWKNYITSKRKHNNLIEIPITKKYKKVIEKLILD